MAQLFVNSNNPACLKLIIAGKYGKTAVHIEEGSKLDQPKRLPALKIDEETVLFIPNAALWFLWQPEVAGSKVREWLEFEASILSPFLSIVLGSNNKDDKHKTTLKSALKVLDTFLETNKFFNGKDLSICDIAIWSSLHPLSQDPSLNKEYLSELQTLSNWLHLLEKEPIFRESLNEYKIESPNCYNNLMTSMKYLSFNSAPIKETNQDDFATSEELESAKKAFAETISDLPTPQKSATVPKPGQRNVLITSALPYVNNVPHLGNIIGCVLSADVFARFSRLCNNNTLFVSGTDEYGTATETKALEENLTCKEICDKYNKIHKEIYQWFNISFDHFGRTSNPEQTELCQQLFKELNENGFMFTQSVEQLHCEQCNRYLADRFVEGGCPHPGCKYEDARGDQCDGCGKLINAIELKNPRCKICKNSPKVKSSTQFFIDLPKLEPLLHHWMKATCNGWSNNAQVIGKAWLKEGLKPRCITRDLKWGVPVPLDGFRDKVFYVWFDAPIGYMSITKSYTKDYLKWWKTDKDHKVTLYQFMAKDNVPFHAVLFPAMLLGANKGYNPVSYIMATEYLNYEDGKFSKSRGVGVFGTDARDTGIPSDVWRFYLLYVRPESQDSSFSWSDLVTKNNSELLNNLGNFINRALMFAKNNFNRTVPEMSLTDDDYNLLALCTREYRGYVNCLEKATLRDGIKHILTISRLGNQYMQSNKPWVLLKGSQEERLRAGTVIGVCCNITCLLGVLLQPYLPETSFNLKKQLNAPDVVIEVDKIRIVRLLQAGHKLGEPSPLFAKIELERAEELKKKYAGKQEEVKVDLDDIEKKVQVQADKVRQLKSSGVDKKVWQPEVAVLLELKKLLERQKQSKAVEVKENCNGNVDVKALEEEINKQGMVVRKLKEAKTERSVWQPELDKLLALKSQLAKAGGEPLPKPKKGKK